MQDKIQGALLGLACGDAVGTTLEFKSRGTFTPIEDMVGGGPFKLEAGQWTDDTSMALCLGHSLAYKKEFDPEDQMNRYCNWYQLGYMSCTGNCFDIGITVSGALRKYMISKNPYSGSTNEMSSGNGSIMRLAPIPIFYHNDEQACLKYAAESSRTTHGSQQCIEACQLFSNLIRLAFNAKNKDEIFEKNQYLPQYEKLKHIARKKFIGLSYEQLKGSGYVVDSLQAALWCFYHANSFEEAILLSANLGDDADTTAAVCGQIAGAFYGVSGIPQHWLETVYWREEISELALNLFHQ